MIDRLLAPFERYQWIAVVTQSMRDLYATNATAWAAALAFYTVISLFPLLIAAIVIASFVADASWAAERATTVLNGFLSGEHVDADRLVEAALEERGQAVVVSLAVFAFTGRRVLGVLTAALNLVSDVDEVEDGVQRRAVVEIALGLGLAGLFVLALSTRQLLDLAATGLRFIPGDDSQSLEVIAGVAQVVLLFLVFAAIYMAVPRGDRDWRAVSVGAIVATALFVIAQLAYDVALDWVLGSISLIYGPLGSAVLLLTWIWYVACITLFGGSLASHVKVMLIEGDDEDDAARRHVPRVPDSD